MALAFNRNRIRMPGLPDNLRNQLSAGLPTFVLIDPLVGEPISIGELKPGDDPQHLRERAWQRPVQRISLHGSCKLPIHQQPYLVMLEAVTDALLEQTLDMAESERREALADGLDGDGMAVHRIGGWLQSNLRPADLSLHIASMLRLRTDAPTTCKYFRLVDRRTLALLCSVIGTERVEAQLGGLQTWCFLDMQGNLAVLQSPGAPSPPIHLSAEEWKTLQDGVAVNRALAQWLGEAKRMDLEILGDPAHQVYGQVVAAVSAAKQIASRHPNCFPRLGDQIVWAALSKLEPALRISPAVQQMLETSSEPFRYLHQEAQRLLEAERRRNSRSAV